ncbi:helix-turn-helix domain-containing protein [Flavobacterium sp. 245]|uniref:helix-turn-helix domain-containing protein n=1 Tax=Flavobacterium sp. 245 TaxID=2512115 RepID=UPI00105F65CC|nr:helix-turn-helix domain-containing protein [Flavobacterium sp. 245]TDP04077.1 helix-turn-helix protein [Flavobacterium sp. 245]
MSVIQFIQYSPDQLQKEINEGIKIQLDEFLKHYKPKPPNEYLTRHELAQMFNVDISTIHNWCKRGILQPRGIGGRVYFLRSQVEASIQPLNV